MNLGHVLQLQGNLDQAIQCYLQVAAQFPAQVAAWRRLAATLSAKGQPDAALATYQQALRHVPNDPSLLLDLGNTYLAQTNYPGAADCFRQALKADPASAGLHYNLAVVLGLQGQPAAKRAELQTALALDPGFTPAQQQLQRLPANP
jgi:tetratricopeptide (TPR) repeat protein